MGLPSGRTEPRKEQPLASLYERLGGTDGITRIASDVVDLHRQNPLIAPRFAAHDSEALKRAAATFFIQGTGGPSVYEGKDMRSAHQGMNIDEAEFVAVLDDSLAALDKNGIGQREKEEVLFVLYSMKGEIVRG